MIFIPIKTSQLLEHFWAKDKVVGAICHGAVALGNIPDIRGRNVTGYTRATSSSKVYSAAASSFQVIRRQCSRALVQTIRRLLRTIPTSSRTTSSLLAKISSRHPNTRWFFSMRFPAIVRWSGRQNQPKLPHSATIYKI